MYILYRQLYRVAVVICCLQFLFLLLLYRQFVPCYQPYQPSVVQGISAVRGSTSSCAREGMLPVLLYESATMLRDDTPVTGISLTRINNRLFKLQVTK